LKYKTQHKRQYASTAQVIVWSWVAE